MDGCKAYLGIGLSKPGNVRATTLAFFDEDYRKTTREPKKARLAGSGAAQLPVRRQSLEGRVYTTIHKRFHSFSVFATLPLLLLFSSTLTAPSSSRHYSRPHSPYTTRSPPSTTCPPRRRSQT